jgi:hypothetical protein
MVFFTFILLGCSSSKQDGHERILGRWLYVTAESLGDYSQNDSVSIADFNQTMKGKTLAFYDDSSYIETNKIAGRDSVQVKGHYYIASGGRYMVMDNKDSLRIVLTDSTFKFYSSNNAVFVWKKIER